MQRRTLLKLGLGATAVLAVAGGGLALLRPGLEGGRMTASAKVVFKAVARGVLDGTLPKDEVAREAALEAHLKRLDDTLAAFPRATQSELSQLLALISAAPGRSTLVGLHTDWEAATAPEIQQALQGMRTSSLAMRQQAYHALRDLTNAAYFADPQGWSALGYPGPLII
ncbi:hypothetical protein [Piscinibacter terrae]|uniref:Uncharacterized protein n=1 Tax=Piscinibacter terrae TaxID=2496871 RepID=A0A3N7IVY4_9BURK|nr:hypothetical protein [Albitalea terrae]RQP22942.1 hypothetical protein DZC73_17575 [Albitalea terrae]